MVLKLKDAISVRKKNHNKRILSCMQSIQNYVGKNKYLDMDKAWETAVSYMKEENIWMGLNLVKKKKRGV